MSGRQQPRQTNAVETGEIVVVDRHDPIDRYRYACPNGHIRWDRTNSHIWCRSCRQAAENGDEELDPEHYEILDKKSGETIAWGRVRLAEDER